MNNSLNNKKGFVIAFLLLMLCANHAFASSIFSRRSIGLLRYSPSTISMGMGGVGIATISSSALPYLNPAGLSSFNLTRFEGSFYFENADVSFSGDEARFSRATFNSFQAVFPIKTGYALGIGLIPFSDVSYKISRDVDFPETSAVESISGTGGLERGFIQLGGRIGNWLAFGAGFDVYFGRIERTWRLIFDSSEYNHSIDEISSYIDGVGGHAGFIFKLGKYVDAGTVFYFPASLKAETKTKFNFNDESEKKMSTVKLPFSHGYGVNFNPNSRFQAGFDLFFQSWSAISPEEFFASKTDDTYRLGMGVSYKPSNDPLAGFFSKITYRMGFHTSTLPYLTGNDEQLRESLFSFGFSLPFNFNISKIDFGMEYGIRGSIDINGAEETVFRFVIGVTGGERWFVRR
jgi:hypothetical protein